MFTSSRLAPPRTCSSATSTAAEKSSASISRLNRADPVTFVRSPIVTKPVSGPISNVSRPLNRGRPSDCGNARGASPRTASPIACVCSGFEPQQRAHDVEQPLLRELAEQRRRHVGGLVVAAEGVRQAGIRMARRQARSDAREVGDVRPHLVRTERAVDADDQRFGVLDRRPERLDRLSGQHPARQVDDRRADPERQLRRLRAGRDDRGFRVEGVEDRLDQQQVDAPVGQAANLLRVCLDDLVEGVRPEAGIVDAGAEREGDVERPDRSGDEPAVHIGDLARDPGARDVQVVDRFLEPVVGLADRRRGERVGRGDVAARGEVRLVHPTHDVGTRQVQNVGIVVQIARMGGESLAAEVGLREPAILQQHAPGTVEHEDALLGDSADVGCDGPGHSSLGV